MFMSNLDSGEEAEVQRLNEMIARLEGRDFSDEGDSDGEGRRVDKRNYNLDHLARMNFRRSMGFNSRHILGGLRKRALNNRHILGGLRKKALNDRHIFGGLKRGFNDRHIFGGLKRALNNRHILGGL